MTLTDEFTIEYGMLSEDEQRAMGMWFALHKDYPKLFPSPQRFQHGGLLIFIHIIETFADEIADRRQS
jgi:hypothetical protein